jgi:rhodanese-related sulfurtransferase
MPSVQKTKEYRAMLIGALAISGIVLFYAVQALQGDGRHDSTGRGAAEEMPKVPSLKPSDVIQALSSRESAPEYLLLDIRSEEEYRTEHVLGSRSMPLEVIGSSPLPTRAGSTKFVLISSGQEEGRALQAGRLFLENGLKSVFILQGGIEEWKSQGGRTLSFGDPQSFLDQSKVTFLKPDDLKKSLEQNGRVTVVDTRPSESFAQGHIPGAVNIPLADLENRYSEIPLGKKIVVHGNSALEDFQAGVRLFDLHFFGAQVLEGGFSAWKDKGFPVE